MRKTIVTLMCTALLLAGCSGDGDEPDTAAPLPTPGGTTTSAPSTPAPSDPAPSEPATTPTTDASGTLPPAPDAAQTAQLLQQLAAAAPELIRNPQEAIARAREICADVAAGRDRTEIVDRARAELEGSALPDVTPEQAEAIVSAVQANLCS